MTATQAGRELWKREGLDDEAGAYPKNNGPLSAVDDAYEANLVSSHAAGEPGMHLPAIDIDHPCRLVETSPGKYHLYIDKAVSWDAYRGVLHAMAIAGIVEPGFASIADVNGATFLRLRPAEKRRK